MAVIVIKPMTQLVTLNYRHWHYSIQFLKFSPTPPQHLQSISQRYLRLMVNSNHAICPFRWPGHRWIATKSLTMGTVEVGLNISTWIGLVEPTLIWECTEWERTCYMMSRCSTVSSLLRLKSINLVNSTTRNSWILTKCSRKKYILANNAFPLQPTALLSWTVQINPLTTSLTVFSAQIFRLKF